MNGSQIIFGLGVGSAVVFTFVVLIIAFE